MAIELMLVRHGKAEDRSADKDDTQRELTEEGQEDFRAFLASVKKDVETDRDVSVWTSPMKRAKQTAQLLTDEMGWPKAEEKEFLASGDFTAFRNDLKTLDSDTRVVCVGHKPIQGDWLGVLTGSPYSFKKGGIALVRLHDDRTHGRLLWDNDPKAKKKADKKAEPIKEILLKQYDAVEEAYRHFQNNPYSPKRTHRFRVNMRKLRSLLHFVKPLIGEETYDELNEGIKDAYHRVEPIREADVLIDYCGGWALEEPELVSDYSDLFRYLHNERRKWMRSRLTKSMTEAFEEMLKETHQAITQLTFNKRALGDKNLENVLAKRFKKRKKKVLKSFEKADHSVHREAHEVRKQAKKLRYAAKGYKELLPSKQVKKVKKKTKAIQNDLGEISDLHTNSELLDQYAERAKDTSLKEAFRVLAEKQQQAREDIVESNELLSDA